MTERTDVVISSTSKDLTAHRAQAKAAIEQWGGYALVMENLPPSPEDAITESLKLVDDSEIYVGIFAHRYGYIPDSPRNPDRISITEMEYRRAVERGIPVLIFVMHDEHTLTADMVEKGEGAAKLQHLKDELTTQYVVSFFRSPEDLRGHVLHGLNNLQPSHDPSGWRPSPIPPVEALPVRGELPPGSRVLVGANPHFVGRERDMLTLAETLLHGTDDGGAAVITPAAAATGAGGIGKTQLAVEFAHRYGRCFYGVHWLNLQGITDDDPSRADAEIAACGQALNLPGFPETQPEQVALTLETWRKSPPRLVILDNAEKPAAVHAVLGRLPAGMCVLVTSRWDREGQWRDIGVTPAELDVLDRVESRALLRGIAEQLQTAPDAELDTLAERLGDYPLALDLAAHYLRDTGLSVADYLTALDGLGNILEHRSLRTWAAEAENANATQHDTDVARTFALSWERVTNSQARDLFLACGYLAPNEPIPDDLLLALMEGDAEPLGNAEDMALARAQLSGAGLLRADPVQIHPLLAAFARAQDGAVERLLAVAKALRSLSYAATGTGLPADFAPLRAHTEATAVHADSGELEHTATLWNNLGYHLKMVADYSAARRCYERALAIDERVHGPDHPDVATDANNLGTLLRALGDLPAARVHLERALAIWERALGEDHPNVASAASNLGMLLKGLSDLPAARALYERALAIDERVYGTDHPQLATHANNLGVLLHDLGDLPAARAHYERALAILERVLGENHPQVAIGANNLGMLLRDLGDLPGARVHIERALVIDERVYGLDHPNVAIRANNLGLLCVEEGDRVGAQAWLQRALRIWEATLPPEHPNIQIVRESLAYLDELEAGE